MVLDGLLRRRDIFLERYVRVERGVVVAQGRRCLVTGLCCSLRVVLDMVEIARPNDRVIVA